MKPKSAYFISRHAPTVEQHHDMLRICKEKGIPEYKQLLDLAGTIFKRRNKAHKAIPEGSILFLVGTTEHATNARKCGYIIYRPKFSNRLHFLHHCRFVYCKLIEVPA